MLAAVNPPPTTCQMAMLSLACLLLHMQSKRGGALVTYGQPRLSHAVSFGHTAPGLTNDCGLDGDFVVR